MHREHLTLYYSQCTQTPLHPSSSSSSSQLHLGQSDAARRPSDSEIFAPIVSNICPLSLSSYFVKFRKYILFHIKKYILHMFEMPGSMQMQEYTVQTLVVHYKILVNRIHTRT